MTDECAACGEPTSDLNGFPRLCECERDRAPQKNRPKCPECGKHVKAAGLADHRRMKHGIDS